jgi:hypothetical protein
MTNSGNAAWGLGVGLKIPYRKTQNVTKCFTGHRALDGYFVTT